MIFFFSINCFYWQINGNCGDSIYRVKRTICERTSNTLSHSCFASSGTFYLDSQEDDIEVSRKKSCNHVYTTCKFKFPLEGILYKYMIKL